MRGIVLPAELSPVLAMSAPLAISTGSWNRLSGVRFSWKMTTICCSFAGLMVLGDLLAPQPFRLISTAPAKTSKNDRDRNAARLINDLPSDREIEWLDALTR